MVDKELETFLTAVQEYVEYWAAIDLSKGSKEYIAKHDIPEMYWRLHGLAHSILCLIDGVSSANDFHMYDLQFDGKTFNDCYMHEIFSNFEREKRGE